MQLKQITFQIFCVSFCVLFFSLINSESNYQFICPNKIKYFLSEKITVLLDEKIRYIGVLVYSVAYNFHLSIFAVIVETLSYVQQRFIFNNKGELIIT